MSEHRDPILSPDSEEPPIGSSFGPIERDSFDSVVSGGPAAVTAPQAKPSKRSSGRGLKVALFSALAIVLAVAIGFFGLMAWDGFQEKKQAQEVAQAEEQKAREKAEAIRTADNPFSVLVGSRPVAPEDPYNVIVENNQLQAGPTALAIAGGELTPTVNPCSLVAPTDVCLGARGKLGDGQFDVLAVKDISRTRILDNPSSFNELTGGSSSIAASLVFDMGEGVGPTQFGALGSNSTVGFVLIFPSGTTPERVEEVLKAAAVI